MSNENKEYIALIDDNDQVIGKSTRQEVHAKGEGRHRVACVLVFNQAGEILIQKRSPTVSMYPDCWSVSSAGHVGYGDDYLATALRELAEEVGIKAQAEDLQLLGKKNIPLPGDDELWQVYKYTTNQTEFKIQAEEVAKVKFVGISELKKMINDSPENFSERARRLFEYFLFK